MADRRYMSPERRAAGPIAAALLYEVRAKLGLTLADVGALIGVDESTPKKWEDEGHPLAVTLRDVIALGRERPEVLYVLANLLEREADRVLREPRRHPLRRLTDEQEREMFALRRAGMPYRQIALRLRIPMGTVQSACHRRGKAA